jgi:hypothetical protein
LTNWYVRRFQPLRPRTPRRRKLLIFAPDVASYGEQVLTCRPARVDTTVAPVAKGFTGEVGETRIDHGVGPAKLTGRR